MDSGWNAGMSKLQCPGRLGLGLICIGGDVGQCWQWKDPKGLEVGGNQCRGGEPAGTVGELFE